MKGSCVVKRVMALCLSLATLLSLCVVPVSAFEETVPFPLKGTILYDDFETYESIVDTRISGGGPYSSCGGSWPGMDGENKVFASQVNGGASTLWYKNESRKIDSGKLSIQAKIKALSGYDGNSYVASTGRYPSAYFGIWRTTSSGASTVPLVVFGNTSNSDKAKGGAIYAGGEYWLMQDKIDSDSVTYFSADEYHDFAIVLDYTNNITVCYLDGEKIGEYAGALAFDVGNEFGLVADYAKDENFAPDSQGDRPQMFVDDMKLMTAGTLNVAASYTEAKTIEVDFGAPVVLGKNGSLSDVTLETSSGLFIAMESCTFNTNQDKLTILLEEEMPLGSQYLLDLGQGLFINAGDPGDVYDTPGNGLVLYRELSKSVVLNQTFDNVTFPANEEGKKDVDWLTIQQSTGSNNDYTDMSDWRFYEDSREYAYVKEAAMNGGKAMQFSAWLPVNRTQGSASVVLPFDKSISGGTLTIEFDADFVSGTASRMAFGLHDTEDNITNYNPWLSWGDATYLGGLTYWSGATGRELKVNTIDKPNMLPDGYMYHNTPESSAYNPNSGTWAIEPTAHLNSDTVIDQKDYPGTYPAQRWKYVLNLDEECYDFYLDGVHQKHATYIPGGEAGTYDAFVATILVAASGTSQGDASRMVSIYLDNVKVTHTPQLPTVKSVSVTDYLGNTTVLSDGARNIPTGTVSASIVFSAKMDADTLDEVQLTASSGDINYTKSLNEKRLTLTFPEGLVAETNYTLSLGDMLSQTGYGFAYPETYTFTTDDGEQSVGGMNLKIDDAKLVSLKSIKEDSVITAEAYFINTLEGREPVGGTIMMAAYNDGVMRGVKVCQVEAEAGVRVGRARAVAGTDGFYGADQIRVFLFDSIENIQPLTISMDLPGDSAYALFDEYDKLNYAVDTKAITSARLGSGDVPNVETASGRTGWRLDASVEDSAYISVDLSGEFTDGLDTDETVRIEVDYYSDSYGGFAILYQSKKGEKEGLYNQLLKEGGWRTAVFDIDNASFANDSYGYDFHIITSDIAFRGKYPYMKNIMGTSAYDVLIGAVRVSKVKDSISPYDITVETGKPGNVFTYGTYGENMVFDITYSDPKGKYNSGTAVYTVKDSRESEVWSKRQDFTGGEDTLRIPYAELPLFGVYTLEIEVSGNGVSQKKVVDFSSALKGVTNLRYGTNLHYDSGTYTQQDIKDQIDLVYNSGIGFTRSKIDWNTVQKTVGGEYVMQDNVLFANQYLDSLGMENLCILNQQNWAYVGSTTPYHYLTTQAQRDAWADFCTYIVTELKDYTKYYAISNEFNLQGPGAYHPYDHYQSNHNPDNYPYYVDIVKAAYPAIKAAYSDAVVVTGEVGRYEDEWIQECYDLGLADYSDVTSYHVYEYATGPEYYVDYQQSYNDGTGNTWRAISPWKSTQVASEFFGRYGEKTWLTETGAPSREDNILEDIPNLGLTHSEMARYLPRYFVLLGHELDQMFNYSFTNNNTGYFHNEDNFGIVRAHDWRTPFAAMPAYITVSALNYFTGDDDFVSVAPTFIGNESNYQARGYVVQYEKSENYPDGVIMAWKGDSAGTKTTIFSIPGANNLYVYDMYGNWKATIANGTNYTLTPEPIYVVKAN